MLKEELKIGDNEDSQNEEDWSWEESDQDWEGTEERREKERQKKITRYRRRKQLEERTAKKVRHMIGLGPVQQDRDRGFRTSLVGDFRLGHTKWLPLASKTLVSLEQGVNNLSFSSVLLDKRH